MSAQHNERKKKKKILLSGNQKNESKRAIWRGRFSVPGNSMNYEKFLALKTKKASVHDWW